MGPERSLRVYADTRTGYTSTDMILAGLAELRKSQRMQEDAVLALASWFLDNGWIVTRETRPGSTGTRHTQFGPCVGPV